MLAWLLAAGLACPFFLWQPQPAWAKGLWLGQALGLLTAGWIRLSVRQALGSTARPRAWVWHGTGRLLVVGLALWLALKFLAFSVWAIVTGYTWMLWLTAIWQAYPMVWKQRGVR